MNVRMLLCVWCMQVLTKAPTLPYLPPSLQQVPERAFANHHQRTLKSAGTPAGEKGEWGTKGGEEERRGE